MALNIDRWFKYAQAKLKSSLANEHEAMDELEAERAEEVADKPWLSSDAETPTFDEAKARIEWESGQGQETSQARLELDRRERESKERLEAIRDELGVDPPDEGGA